MERHLQTIGVAVITAAIVAIAGLGWQMSHQLVLQTQQLTNMGTEIQAIRADVERVNQKFELYMPRAEANARFDAIRVRDDDLTRRLDRLEGPK